MSLKNPLIILLLLASTFVKSYAQDFTYLYFQGNKEIPFYLKLDGEMQPRLAKNFSIISQLVPGVLHIQILFQQNKYPPQSFTLLVPEKASRGFLITKNQDQFSLYDLDQNFYLFADNKLEDDHLLPTFESNDKKVFEETKTVQKSKINQFLEQIKIESKNKKDTADKNPHFLNEITIEQSTSNLKPTEKIIQNTNIDTTKIQENISLNKKNSDSIVQKTIVTSNEILTKNTIDSNENALVLPIRNSDCPTPIENSKWERMQIKLSAITSNENRLNYLLDHADECYSTEQSKVLSLLLFEEESRFIYFQKIYPHITNQAIFQHNISVFKEEKWIRAFKNLVNPL